MSDEIRERTARERSSSGRKHEEVVVERSRLIERLLNSGANLSREATRPIASQGQFTAGPTGTKAALIEAYFTARPDVTSGIEAALHEAESQPVDSDARRATIAARPAEVASRAQLHHVATIVPDLSAELREGLAEYLARRPESRRAEG